MSRTSKLLLTTFVVLFYESLLAYCFPSGAPTDVCDTLTPRHVGTRSLPPEKSPYFLTASSNQYGQFFGKDEGVKVELGGAPFKGFLIQAIDPMTGKRIGRWLKVKGTDTLPCSAITHTNNRNKRYAALIWLPPPYQKGYVDFVATVVHSYDRYFVGIRSRLPPDSYKK